MVSCKDCGNGTRCMCSFESKFDTENALCDILMLIENQSPKILIDFRTKIDPKTLEWWKHHEKREENKIKKEALAKLTSRERRLLGI